MQLNYKILNVISQESHAVAGKQRDAAVIFNPYVSNMINKGLWYSQTLSYITYLIYIT